MSNLFWMTGAQMARRRPFFPKSHGKPRVDDRRVLSDMNTRLHAVADADGRPIHFFMTAGQVNDRTGAAALPGSLPKAERLLADRGQDARRFREALKDKGIKPCIPGRASRGKPIRRDKRRHKRRNWIEIMFGRLKDWRRVATRCDRCPEGFLSALALAATVMFRLGCENEF